MHEQWLIDDHPTCQQDDQNFQIVEHLRDLAATSNKAKIRTTYRDIFIRAISSFIPIARIPRRINTSDRFTICARVRPFLEQEILGNDIYECVTTNNSSVTVHAGNSRFNRLEIKHTTFHFDEVFGKNSTNLDVYAVVRKLIAQSIPTKDDKPVDSTVFLYGKTGTGKTHTILGIAEQFVQDLFYLIAKSQIDVRVGISAVEIVAGTKGFIVSKDDVCDLYNHNTRVYFREDTQGTVHLRGATEYKCDNSTQLNNYIKQAIAIRRTQATISNAQSSRSHLVYFIRIRAPADDFKDGEILSTITFVDLAGNEGQRDSLFYTRHSDQIRDSTSINRTLATLQDCIRAASTESNVIPFRGSVLTRLLKKCFCSSEAKSVFIGTISGLPMDTEQSVMTLKYVGLIKWPLQDFIVDETLRLNRPI